MKLAWIDLRSVPAERLEAVVDAALHARVDALVADDPAVLAPLPPTVRKVLTAPAGKPFDTNGRAPGPDTPDDGSATVTLVEARTPDEVDALTAAGPDAAAFVHVRDDASLRLACQAASSLPHTVVRFQDPTKIPLEIVIAAADSAPGALICHADDLEEAGIVVDVLEKGSEGVLLAPRSAADVFGLVRLLRGTTPPLALSKLTIRSIRHQGLGDRVCVDTCTHFEPDEGLLVGSYSSGFILCCSETHPLPYMPTRPFRINAGALHSYVYGADNRTNYLSELQAGSTVLGVNVDGGTRRIVVGRAKLESRPLLSIDAESEDGVRVNLIVQDDWHVRVLGPGGSVLNVTELKEGDQVLGYLATGQRHVGWPVGEFCLER